jgi:hypothetical protein
MVAVNRKTRFSISTRKAVSDPEIIRKVMIRSAYARDKDKIKISLPKVSIQERAYD